MISRVLVSTKCLISAIAQNPFEIFETDFEHDFSNLICHQ